VYATTLSHPFPRHALTPSTDREAGQAFRTAAAIYKDKLNEPSDVANAMSEAFKVLRKEDPAAAIECIQVTIDCYTSSGHFRRAASHVEAAAEMLEVEMGDRKKAMEYYNRAAQWYEDDGAKA
jgi:alpha-soluble NSF attachment protein